LINLKINNMQLTVAPGTTLLQAAQQLNIEIPTLCYMADYEPYTSCMLCVVQDIKSDQLLPACSARVVNGMVIETENEKVRQARKDTLDLLLSEHLGNCEAPCMRACPAYMDIPLMIRYIKERKFNEALITVKKSIALPAVLGRICPAPCERGCNRKYLDHTLNICLLKRFVADVDLYSDKPYLPVCKKDSGKKVAIVGAGPTGLAAAYFLRQKGHSCYIYDSNREPGGLMRYAIPDEKLDKNVLDTEIQLIRKLSVKFHMNMTLGKDISLAELRQNYNAVILAMGTINRDSDFVKDIKVFSRGILVNSRTFETNLPGVFAGGNAIAEGRMAIRSLAHGRFIAHSVDQLLTNLPITGFPRRFNSVLGRLTVDEGEEYAKQADKSATISPQKGIMQGYLASEAVEESKRCFRCDCRKQVSCKLREYADRYHASQLRFKTGERKKFSLVVQHESVLYEPGKCIKCGLCVQITEKAGEKFGLTFIDRGFDIRVAVPLNENLQKGLEKVARQCVEACPTAALALNNHFEVLEDVAT